MMHPQAQILVNTLTTADGSATYTSPRSTHTLVAGVNYPVEVPYRSDEDPESTYIEVSVRPHNGVTMVRERHVEEIIRRTLKTTVIGEDTPRACLQVTVQVLGSEVDEALPGGVKAGQAEGWLDLLVGGVNTSIAACLDAGVSMRGLIGAVLVGVSQEGIVVSPDVRQRRRCASLHAFGFDTTGACVLMESQGAFEIDEWEQAESVAKEYVCGSKQGIQATNGDVNMEIDNGDSSCLFDLMRRAIETRVTADEQWRQ